MKYFMPFSETNLAARERLLLTIALFFTFFFTYFYKDGSKEHLGFFSIHFTSKVPSFLEKKLGEVAIVGSEDVLRPVGFYVYFNFNYRMSTLCDVLSW